MNVTSVMLEIGYLSGLRLTILHLCREQVRTMSYFGLTKLPLKQQDVYTIASLCKKLICYALKP